MQRRAFGVVWQHPVRRYLLDSRNSPYLSDGCSLIQSSVLLNSESPSGSTPMFNVVCNQQLRFWDPKAVQAVAAAKLIDSSSSWCICPVFALKARNADCALEIRSALQMISHVHGGSNSHTRPRGVRTLAWQRTEAAYDAEREQETLHSHAKELRGYQRPVSLKELKRRKEKHQAGDGGGEIVKPKGDTDAEDAEASGKDKRGSNKLSAEVETFNSGGRSPNQVTPLSGPKDRPALRHRRAPMRKLVTSIDSVESNSHDLVLESAGGSFLSSANELQSEELPSTQGSGILNIAPQVAKQPGPRFLTVEDFLRREAEKRRGQGVDDSDNNALVALKSIGTSSPTPDRNERSKRRSQRAAQSGPQWKIQYKEEDVDDSHEADPAEIDDAKEKALSLLNRRHISAAELRNKLTQNGFPANVVKVVADRMQEIGLQNDLEYAEAFARVRWQSFRWGPDRVRRELKAKGIGTDNLDEAIRTIYGDRADTLRVSPEAGSELEESAGQNDEEDVSAIVERELYVAAKRHFLSDGGSDVNRRWKRTADWLARRGFSWGTASSIMVALKAEADVWK